jgi:RNA polymerase sigma-70 factor, ECF subfamily
MNSTDTLDTIFIDRFKNGDPAALDSLVKRHLARTYSHATRLTGNRDMAGDVVADALFRFSRAATRFKGESALSTYLHTLTRNCFLDLRSKALRRQTEGLDDVAAGEEAPTKRQFESSGPSPHVLAERGEREQVILNAVEALPESQRELIALFYYNTLSYEDIALKLRVPVGTIKSRLHRARATLREVLEGDRLFSDLA